MPWLEKVETPKFSSREFRQVNYAAWRKKAAAKETKSSLGGEWDNSDRERDKRPEE